MKNKKEKAVDSTVYLHNPTEKDIEISGRVCEPSDAISIPVELEKEARERGLV